MLIALFAHDNPDALDIRTANRAAHLDYLEANKDLVAQAGPLLDDDGNMMGSLIILDVPDMASAQNFATHDPYAHAGLFASVTLTHWKKVIG